MESFIACRNCAGKGIGNKSDGFIYNKSTNTVSECECHKRWRTKKDLLRRMSIAGIGFDDFILNYNIATDYAGRKSIDSVLKIQKYLTEYKNNNPKFRHTLLYIYGGNGTQKTTIGKYITKELLTIPKDSEGTAFNQNYCRATFTTMNNLIKELTKLKNEGDEPSVEYQNIMKSDVLIIDESFDKEKVTIYKSGYQIPYLDSFLRTWMSDTNKSLIFISNVEPSDIAKNGYSNSIQDFIIRYLKINKTDLLLEDNFIQSMDQFDVSKGLFD